MTPTSPTPKEIQGHLLDALRNIEAAAQELGGRRAALLRRGIKVIRVALSAAKMEDRMPARVRVTEALRKTGHIRPTLGSSILPGDIEILVDAVLDAEKDAYKRGVKVGQARMPLLDATVDTIKQATRKKVLKEYGLICANCGETMQAMDNICWSCHYKMHPKSAEEKKQG